MITSSFRGKKKALKMLLGNFYVIFIVIPLCYSACNVCNLTNDLTLKEKAVGHDVVCAVIRKISDSGIFPDDKGILRRIAYVESKFGQDKNTFRKGYYGGIWQIDDGPTGAYTEITKHYDRHSHLHKHILHEIKKTFGIDIKEVKYEELVKPLYSGLFARILLSIKPAPIPENFDLDEQAQYWKTHFNSGQGKGDIKKFKDDVNVMEKEFGQFCDNCQGRMNLAIVMDGSGSIGSQHYEDAKKAAVKLIDTFSEQSFDVGFVVFSLYSEVIFPLRSNLTRQQMKSKILQSEYPSSETNTHLGISDGVKILEKTDNAGGIPKVIALFTDGHPSKTGTDLEQSLGMAARSNVTIFAIGIGSNINNAVLERLAGSPSRVLMVTSYAALSRLFNQINSKTCTAQQTPVIGKKVVDMLVKKEKRYFKFPMPQTGITIKTKTREGKTQGCYSYSHENPTSAINDGQFVDEVFIPPQHLLKWKRHVDQATSSIFVTIEGQEDKNQYDLDSFEGDQTIKTTAYTELQTDTVADSSQTTETTEAIETQTTSMPTVKIEAQADINDYTLDSSEENRTDSSTSYKSKMLIVIFSFILSIKVSAF